MNLPPDLDETVAVRFVVYEDPVVTEIRALPACADFSEERLQTVVYVVSMLDWWGRDAALKLEDSPWSPDELRRDTPLADTKTVDFKKWSRLKSLIDLYDACWTARDLIREGDWIGAMNWAMQAGNRSQMDPAVTGRARGTALASGRKKSRYVQSVRERHALILREAEILFGKNAYLTASSVAKLLESRNTDGVIFPKAETIRKIFRQANFGKE